MEKELAQYLADGEPLIADGATGTMLMAAGLEPGIPPEAWNVERPEQILELHRAYLEAGSQIVLTNTFGGSRIKLAKLGFGDRTRELNLAAAELALQAADGEAFVAGDVGPTGEMMKPLGSLTYEKAVETFSEQITALADGGVNAIWIETMSDLEEARAAVVASRQVSSIPVLCSLSFRKKAYTIMGISARHAAQELWPLGLSAIGANCGEGLEMIPEVLKQMRQHLPTASLIAKPNAGRPKRVRGQVIYDVDPDEFAAHVETFIALGAQIVGSCCGSSPAYIERIAAVLGKN